MTRMAAHELPGDVVGERSPFPSVSPSFHFDSPQAEKAAVSETVDSTAAWLSEAGGRIPRSEPRTQLDAVLWLTSLHKPGVFEVVPTENVSRVGVQMVTRKSWEPAELVLVSFPPGFYLQGLVIYCKKLPSEDYLLGIRLHAPVEDWSETLGLRVSW